MKLTVQRGLARALLVVGSITSCGAEPERPPMLDEEGGGRRLNQTEESTGGTTRGSTAGTNTGAPGGGATYLPPGCTGVYDPNQVYILGVLQEGDGEDSTASIDHPEAPCPGIWSHHPGVIRPTDGRLVFREWDANELRLFTPDPLTWNVQTKRWQRAQKPLENDSPLGGSCADGTRVIELFANPDGAGIVHQCASGGFFDEAGQRVVDKDDDLVALGKGGHKLVSRSTTGRHLVVVDANGQGTEVAGSPTLSATPRAREDGFWIVTPSGVNDMLLEHVSFTGARTTVGTYAARPEGYNLGAGKIDASGTLYEIGYSGSDDVVVKRPFAPGTASVAYSEANAPKEAQDYEQSTPILYVKLHGSSLFTGP